MSDEIKTEAEGEALPEKENGHSNLLGISLRGWIAVIVILTVCEMSVFEIVVKEPLYTLAGLIVGFYFGQNQQTPAQKKT